ncbi:S1 family peptidase [Crenothrix sp.]|uniref:S1 family peptidase n=1 Tax=Crenothrix sp. TaxID=3100433 RepID=UPI00374D6425
MFLIQNSLKFRSHLLMVMAVMLSTGVEAKNPKDMLDDPLINESTPGYDTITYALDRGISYEEGSRRFALRNKIENLEEKLTRDNPDTFAGLWLEHTPEFKIVVQFVGEPKKDISTYLSKELTAITEVRQAEVSLADLERVRTEALDAVANEGDIPIESDIDVRKNRVELYVTDENHLRSNRAIQDMGLQFSGNVAVLKVQSLSVKQALSIYGGLQTQIINNITGLLKLDCTTGFSVRNTVAFTAVPVGTRGITTAGHCLDFQYYKGTFLPYKKGAYTGPYDIQWHTTPGYTPTNKVKVGTYLNGTDVTRTITGTRASSLQLVGEYVCKYGRVSGYTCGYISSKIFKPNSPSNASFSFIKVSNFGIGASPDLSSGGDSGGPWFVEGFAYGSHAGEPYDGFDPIASANNAFYMAINYISGISVAVLTTP